MKRIHITSFSFLVAGIVALVVAVSSGIANTTTRLPAGGAALSVEQTPLGKTLVGANGRTLYLFEADKPNVSRLSRAGFAVWPAFTAPSKPHAIGGVNAAHVSTIAGPHGTRQVTYYGHPLYYFVGDKKAGSTSGQGLNEFGALWYVLSARGSAVTHTATSTPSTSSQPSYNYGSSNYGY